MGQAMDLRGLGAALSRDLPALTELSALDCNLSRTDAKALMAKCRGLEALAFLGNPALGTAEGAEAVDDGRWFSEGEAPWPRMPKVKRADFRHCSLGPEELESLRECFPRGANILVAAVPPAANTIGVPSEGHVFFEDDSEGSGSEESSGSVE